MTEIRKMVYQDKLWNDKSIKKLHMLSYLRLPSLLLIHMLSGIVSIHMCSEFILKKNVITYKFCTAVTSFDNIAALLPTHSFTKEEYNIIQNWLKNIG